ncbi:MAG TPA: Crp/Fnr family transcriptional regulator [Chloroflexota bacterium]
MQQTVTDATAIGASRVFAELLERHKIREHPEIKQQTFAPGETIFRKGDPGDSLYVIQNGQVKIVLPSDGEDEALLGVLEAGDFFGELSLIDGQVRSASAVAAEPTQALVLHRDQFLEFVHASPEFALDVMVALAQRLRQSDEVIADAAFLDVAGRLAKRLVDLAARYGRPSPDGTVISLRLTQRELAGMIGATRESVNKHLQSLRAQRIITADGGRIVIRDLEKLRRRIY